MPTIELTTARVDRANPLEFITALRAEIGDAGVRLDDPGVSGRWLLYKPFDWTAPQIAAAQALLESTAAVTPQIEAQRAVDAWPIAYRALVLTLIDELNILRNLHGLAPRTPAQAITAIRNKAGTLT